MTESNLNKIENKMQALRNLSINLNIEINRISNADTKRSVNYDDIYYLLNKRNSEAFELTKLLIESNKDAYEFIRDYWRKYEKGAWDSAEAVGPHPKLFGIETAHPHTNATLSTTVTHRSDTSDNVATLSTTETHRSDTSDNVATSTKTETHRSDTSDNVATSTN